MKYAGLTSLSVSVTLHVIIPKGQAMCGLVGKPKDVAQLSPQQKRKLVQFLKERKANVEGRLKLIKSDLAKLQRRSKR
jgi:hypothetical protein